MVDAGSFSEELQTYTEQKLLTRKAYHQWKISQSGPEKPWTTVIDAMSDFEVCEASSWIVWRVRSTLVRVCWRKLLIRPRNHDPTSSILQLDFIGTFGEWDLPTRWLLTFTSYRNLGTIYSPRAFRFMLGTVHQGTWALLFAKVIRGSGGWSRDTSPSPVGRCRRHDQETA